MVEEIKYAGFWRRLCADFIDSTLLDLVACLIGLMFLGIFYWGKILLGFPSLEESFFDSMKSFYLQVVLVGIRGLLSLVYFTWAHHRYGTTLGKYPFRVYVVDASNHSLLSLKRSLVRCLSYVVSYVPMSAGFLMVAFQPQKRALHDLIAGSVSVVKAK
jgi:eukaryotic-like serine/threonine-protein kinase